MSRVAAMVGARCTLVEYRLSLDVSDRLELDVLLNQIVNVSHTRHCHTLGEQIRVLATLKHLASVNNNTKDIFIILT